MSDIIAKTRGGDLRGREDKGTLAFLAVPYAAPPVGKLRFHAPQPVEPWQGVRDATKFGPVCPQAIHAEAYAQKSRQEIPRMMPGPDTPQSEDCLTLNVWTPALDKGKRPVMVWLHGGAWTFGLSCGEKPPFSETNGDALARDADMVVVTITHRLGVLGFLHLGDVIPGDEAGCANAGLMDLVAALEWVRDNIASFGGDPDCVTIFGLSGGASKVCALMGLPAAKGLFHRAGVISGHVQVCFDRAEATEVAQELLETLGLGVDQAARLRDVPVEDLVAAQTKMMKKAAGLMGSGLRGLRFNPVVDGITYPQHPLKLIAEGLSANIPMIASTTREEMTVHLIGDPKYGQFTLDDVKQRMRVFLGERADTVVEGYRQDRPGASGTELLCEILGDYMISLPVLAMTEQQLEKATAPSYMAMFCWGSTSLNGALKAYHGVDVPFIFGTTERDARIGADAPRSLVDVMMKTWTTFARTGNPNHSDLPQWPAYDLTGRQAMLFNAECRVEPDPLRFGRRHNQPQPVWPPQSA